MVLTIVINKISSIYLYLLFIHLSVVSIGIALLELSCKAIITVDQTSLSDTGFLGGSRAPGLQPIKSLVCMA